MNRSCVIAAAMAIAWLLSPCAFGLELPNDADLKAAYCAGMTATRIANMKGGLRVIERIDHPEPRAIAEQMRKRITE